MRNSEYSVFVIANSSSFSNPFRVCCRPFFLCEIGRTGEIQFEPNSIGDFRRSFCDEALKIGDELCGIDDLIVLFETGVESKIQCAGGEGLNEQVISSLRGVHAVLLVHVAQLVLNPGRKTDVFPGFVDKGLREVHPYLDPALPTAFFDVEDAA